MADSKPLIMIVDDDDDFRLATKTMLASNGFDVVECNGIEGAKSVYEEKKPQLLLVDLMMEELDAGTLFIEDLRKSAATTPMYIMSSVGDELSSQLDTVGLQITGVLQKPLEEERLVALIKTKLKLA